MTKSTFYRLAAILIVITSLHGCAAVVVGGGATAASLAADRRTAGTVIEDQSIELKAARMIFENKELNEQAHINVTSYNMRVLLSGEAPTETLKSQAVEMVRGIDQVVHVYDEISLAAPSSMLARSSDSVITSKLKTKLITAENVNGMAIKVVTEAGVVYLMGLVTREEADRATGIARQTGGVQKVVKLFQYTD